MECPRLWRWNNEGLAELVLPKPDFLRRLRPFQPHDEFRALVRLAMNLDGPAMSFDDGFHKTQSQPKTSLRPALIAAIKAAPDFLLFVGGDADARIVKTHFRFAVIARD